MHGGEAALGYSWNLCPLDMMHRLDLFMLHRATKGIVLYLAFVTDAERSPS